MTIERAESDAKRDLLRHTLATLAYRVAKTLREPPEGFATFHAGEAVRTPGQILAHIADLMDWAQKQVKGKQEWHDSQALDIPPGSERLFQSISALDEYIASGAPMACSPESLFQGAIADAFTHVGQLAMLRRMAGGPIRPENYHRADIQAGRVTAKQAPPKMEF